MVGEPTRRTVAARAGDRCEYCRIAESVWGGLRFHVDHDWPRQHGGSDETDNLTLACPTCNAAKGPNLSAVDPETGEVVRVFSPRTQDWRDHFTVQDGVVSGRSPTGRATARLLQMNAPEAVALRRRS